MNDVKLQSPEGKHPVDENLRPILVGNIPTALETAQSGSGAKVSGDLIVTGDLKTHLNGRFSSTDLAIWDTNDLTLYAYNDIQITSGYSNSIKLGNYIQFDTNGSAGAGGSLKFMSILDTNDYFMIDTTTLGVTTISTVDDGGTGADLTLDVDGDITLKSASGVFEMHSTGTTAKFADMYAGMILGYTVIGLDATPASFDVTNAMLPVHDDLKVSFVFPPSGKVEILASIYVQTDGARPLTWGLSTTDASTGFTSLGAKYENHTFASDETDGYQHEHRWYITGTAGDSEELWFAAGCTNTNKYDLFWGGDSSAVADLSHPMEYQPFVMKATALPATVYVG